MHVLVGSGKKGKNLLAADKLEAEKTKYLNPHIPLISLHHFSQIDTKPHFTPKLYPKLAYGFTENSKPSRNVSS